MSDKVEFWFDFSSPYAYFAACEIEARVAPYGRAVEWRPFLLGVVFRKTGMEPLAHTPLRGAYARRDWDRLARIVGVPFRLPELHPYPSQSVARAFYWFRDRHPDQTAAFARHAFDAHFVHQTDLRSPDSVVRLAAALCGDTPALADWLQSDPAKQVLADATVEAVAKGVFGSPFFIADDEQFWGWDRIPMLEHWLKRSCWTSPPDR
jgi:2-hydroxychromene-2-carboxylate isomerase